MYRAVFIALVACFSFVSTAHAGISDYVFTVIPTSPIAGQPIQINVTNGPIACEVLPPVLSMDRTGATLRFFVGPGDTCNPAPPQNRTYDIGTLPTGVYLFQFYFCGGLPPGGGDPCTVRSEQTVVVGGLSAGPRVVPALSWSGLSVMLTMFLVGGLMATARFRC